MEDILKELIKEDLKIDVLNGRYYKLSFSDINYLNTKDIELKSKTKFISLKYDCGEWEMLLERWI